jgi:hypothetical protein
MECAVCKAGVQNFHLQGPTDFSRSTSGSNPNDSIRDTDMTGKSFLDSLISPTSSPVRKGPSAAGAHVGLLPSAFECPGISVADGGDFFDGARGVSTPVPGRQQSGTGKECVVLRIDNVPWVRLSSPCPRNDLLKCRCQDITPPAIISWLKQPVVRVHVLLDSKGKTLSHAFVEVGDENVAKALLRTAQNSVLGKGKRARGVTVTMSGQEELMRAVIKLIILSIL